MENNKFCPLVNAECKKERCAWYSKTFEECSALGAGESLTEIMVMADDEGIAVKTYADD